MTSTLSAYNLAVWMAQVLLITSIGALLPLVFRIHHPRSNLVYYRLLLMTVLVLPLVQPVRHEVVHIRAGQLPSSVSATASTPSATVPDTTGVNWRDILLGLIAAGIVVRIGWLAGGLWQLRRLRNSSTPLHPLSLAVQHAREITNTNALFCISTVIKGPVTFGFLRPVILLPESFADMPEDAQRSIACHELIHVRRNDWLLTIFEELIASVLWFQPAVWWLVAQSKLAREQLVDAAVVSLTASREAYIQTLFSLAEAKWEADLGVASLFLRRRHLIHRVHSLLTEVSMSRIRLLSSYCSIALILAGGGGLIALALPLTGEAEIRLVPAEQPGPAQTSPGYVVNRSPISYPVDAQQKRIEGTVVVELTFNARGEIVDSRVLSGPEELRQAGLQTAVQGKYPIDVARTLQVVVDFKLPAAAGQRQGAMRGQAPGGSTETGLFAELTGNVSDPSRNLLLGVTITIKSDQDAAGSGTVVLTDAKGDYRFPSVPPGTYTVSAQLAGFRTVTYNTVLVGPSHKVRLNFALQPGTGVSPLPQNPVAPEAGARGQWVFGGGQPGLAPPPPPPAPGAGIRVGRNIAAGNLITKVPPVYPPAAQQSQVQGVVDLEANINKEGRVTSLTVLSGHPLLVQAAIDAVKQWVYRPTLLNGQPVDIVTTISVTIPSQD